MKGVTEHINLREVDFKYVDFVRALKFVALHDYLSTKVPTWRSPILLFTPFLI